MTRIVVLVAVAAIAFSGSMARAAGVEHTAASFEAERAVYGDACEHQFALSYSDCLWAAEDGNPPPAPKRQPTPYELRLQELYGERCQIVAPTGTQAYGECLLRYADREDAMRAAQQAAIRQALIGQITGQVLANQPQPIPQQDPNMFRPKGTNCTSYVIGGILQTRCQ